MKLIVLLCVPVLLALGSCTPGPAGTALGTPVFDNLVVSDLHGVEGREVFLSRVEIPPNARLPRHWHPGEEFGYVLEGSVTLWLKGMARKTVKAGEAVQVPYKHIHTATTGAEGATILVFRVHEKGQPQRVVVE